MQSKTDNKSTHAEASEVYGVHGGTSCIFAACLFIGCLIGLIAIACLCR